MRNNKEQTVGKANAPIFFRWGGLCQNMTSPHRVIADITELNSLRGLSQRGQSCVSVCSRGLPPNLNTTWWFVDPHGKSISTLNWCNHSASVCPFQLQDRGFKDFHFFLYCSKSDFKIKHQDSDLVCGKVRHSITSQVHEYLNQSIH